MRGIATAILAVAGVAVLAGPVASHPLGNFSISHYTAIQVNEREVELRYVLDLAEIPTFQELRDQGVVADAAHPSALAYAARKADALMGGLRLGLGRSALTLERHGVEIIFPPGAGGLPTLKISARYRATLPPATGPTSLSYRDENYADRAGWKEIIVTAGPGVTLVASSAPEKDRSQALSDYPTDLLDSPPQDLTAQATFTRDRPVVAAEPTRPTRQGPPTAQLSPPPLRAPAVQDPARPEPPRREPHERGAQEAALQPNRQATRDTGLAALLLATPASLGVILLALGVAASLGAFHALEPGHGKTMVAAYLVGSRGTAWHAVVLGLVVTASHTAAVYALGAVTLYASRYVMPERIYPWLAVATGATIAGLGLYLFARRYTGEHEHGHDHHHEGHHHHHGHDGDDDDAHAHAHGEPHAHAHDHHHAHHDRSGHHHGADVSLKQLFTLGVTGGIVPCPAALVVLLAAVSMGRIGFGLLLIVAFSVGLAAVLIVTGLLVVYARRFMLRVQGEGRVIARWLPLTSAAAITLIGAAMTIRALQAVLTGGGTAG